MMQFKDFEIIYKHEKVDKGIKKQTNEKLL